MDDAVLPRRSASVLVLLLLQALSVRASTVGLMLAPLLAPSRIDQTYTSYLRFAAVGLSILLPIVSILTLATAAIASGIATCSFRSPVRSEWRESTTSPMIATE